MNPRLSSSSIFIVACIAWIAVPSCSDNGAGSRVESTAGGTLATTGTSGATVVGAGTVTGATSTASTTTAPGSTGPGGSVGSGGSGGSTGSTGNTTAAGGSCVSAFEGETLEADPCVGVAPWDAAEIWNNYKSGDLRIHNGSLWSCHTPAWCQTEPGGANSNLGWDAKGMCASSATGAGGSGGAGSAGDGGASGGRAGSSAAGGSTGAGGSCGSNATTSTSTGGGGSSGGRGGAGGAGGAGNVGGAGGGIGTGACVLDTLLPAGRTTFDSMFIPPWQGHVASPVLSYQGLCQALAKPGLDVFARSGTAEQNKRELAAFLAQVAKETAYLEKPVQDGAVAGSTEWGRGALQLTHSYNYAAAGSFLGVDLVGNPDSVGKDPVLAWSTALWFWMKYHNTSAGTDPTCHDLIMMGTFGETTRKINSISCGSSDATTRAGVYQSNCMKLGVTVGGATSC